MSVGAVPPFQPGGPNDPQGPLGSPAQEMRRLGARVLRAIMGLSYSHEAQHYTYQARARTAVNAAAGSTVQDSVQVSADAIFVCTMIRAGARVAVGGTNTVGDLIAVEAGLAATGGNFLDVPFDIEIQDGGSGLQLQNEPVDGFFAYGGQFGQVLRPPRRFRDTGNIQIAMTLLQGVPANEQWDLTVHFIGFKIYDEQKLIATFGG